MDIRLATFDDIEQLHRLERHYLNDELGAEVQSHAFDGQAFGMDELKHLLENGWIVVAKDKQNIVGYVIAGPWSFFQNWPIYRHILKQLSLFSLQGIQLTQDNTCQYGPIWIQKAYRGKGIFEQMVTRLKDVVSARYAFMLTFIAEDNMISFAAHTNKASMPVLDFYF